MGPSGMGVREFVKLRLWVQFPPSAPDVTGLSAYPQLFAKERVTGSNPVFRFTFWFTGSKP